MGEIKNLTGQTFGRLTAIAPANKNKNRSVFWEFSCSCGNLEKILCVDTQVTSGNVYSCGCLPIEIVNKQRFRDLSDQYFGRLRAIATVGKSRHGKYLWKCCCNCGIQLIVVGGDLVSGKTLSCGCLSREKVVERNTSHRLTNTRPYRIWANIIQRCTNSIMGNSWTNYGGRGIEVCDRWLHSFENFLEDMGHPPSFKQSIDRIDNEGDYESGNCRWATREEQANNKRNNVLITHKEKTQTVAQWAKDLGVNHGMIRHRLKAGISPKDALLQPTKTRRKTLLITYQGKTQTINQWAIELEISRHTIASRFHKELSIPEILSKNKLKAKSHSFVAVVCKCGAIAERCGKRNGKQRLRCKQCSKSWCLDVIEMRRIEK